MFIWSLSEYEFKKCYLWQIEIVYLGPVHVYTVLNMKVLWLST